MMTEGQRYACDAFIQELQVTPRKTKKPMIVAMVGLVGSGKSEVARELALPIGATIIEGDQIRVHLRLVGERYEVTQEIAEEAALAIIWSGGNAIVDADHIDPKKRAGLRKVADESEAHLIFIRTFANPDVVIGRIITSPYRNIPEDFFGGAKTIWQGSEQSRGAVIKVREMWRRTPHHYDWSGDGGGKCNLKNLDFPIFAMLDTTVDSEWIPKVQAIADQISQL